MPAAVIGRVTVLELARRGGNVKLAAQSREILEVDRLAAEAVGTFGKIDVWLNDAAMLVFGEFTQIPTEDFRIVLETNLFGFIYGARAAVCQFYRQGYGTLINMGSVSWIVGQPYSVPYSISRGGIRSLSIALGQELETTSISMSARCTLLLLTRPFISGRQTIQASL